MDEPGVRFPLDAEGRRSTSAVGRRVVAAALRAVDAAAAAAAERERQWRSGYVPHFRRLVEAGLSGAEDWQAIAAAGLDAVGAALTVCGADGIETPLGAGLPEAGAPLGRAELGGRGAGRPELVLPYRDRELRGDGIRRQLDDWAARGVLEPSAAEQVERVLAAPELLRLEGHTVAVLGAGAELGPLPVLLGWGATVAAVDLPDAQLWRRLLGPAGSGPGRLLAPLRPGATGSDVATDAGADLLREPAAVADWLAELPGRLTIGNYAYADGGRHVLLAAAADAIGQRVRARRPDVGVAALATPADVFAVPPEAVEHARHAYAHRSAAGRLVEPVLRVASRGRLLQPAYRDAGDPALVDALAPVQGPNYALAKRIQRWRACLAAADGGPVSAHVAPSARTRSVLHNRTLAAVYAGAPHFGIEVFAPDTARVLMAALLVHDLQFGVARSDRPWRDEAVGAVHGGVWRMPYDPRSALGLAAPIGWVLPH